MKQITIIKIGGNVIESDEALALFFDQFFQIKGEKILVHGGGSSATELANKLGINQKMVDGRRITDAETLKIAVMMYAGWINKKMVSLLQKRGVNAIGLCGADMNLVESKMRKVESIDYGFVGDVVHVNSDQISLLLKQKITPVFASITHDNEGQLLNTNADTMATEIAISLSSKYSVRLILAFEKPGVLLDVNMDDSTLKRLTKPIFLELKKQGEVSKGMIPKLENSFNALENGVQTVQICSYKNLNINSGTHVL